MTPEQLTAKYQELGSRWNPTPEELAAPEWERVTVADRLHLRRCEVIEELSRMEPLEAAYIAGKMALDMRAYGRLGQYLRHALHPDDPDAKPIDIMAPFAPFQIRPVTERRGQTT